MINIDERYGDPWNIDEWPSRWGLPPVGTKIYIDDETGLPEYWEVTAAHVISRPNDEVQFVVVDIRPWSLSTRLRWRWGKLVHEWLRGERDEWLEPYASHQAK